MRQTIADLAYALWLARGSPEGSAEIDWAEAERQVLSSRASRTDRDAAASGESADE